MNKVEVILSASSIYVVPGESYQLGVTVINNTEEVERYELSLNGLDPSWYQFDWTDLQLYPNPPGNEATSYVRITIPSDAYPQTYSPEIEVVGVQSGTSQHPFLLIVNTLEGVEPELSLSPESQETRLKFAQYQFKLVNTQSNPISLPLRASSERSDVQINFSPPLLELPAFGEGTSLVRVQPRHRNWYQEEQSYPFIISAEGLNKGVSGLLVQTCQLPWLHRLLTTPALFAAALLLPLLLTIVLILALWPSRSLASTNKPSEVAECVLPNTLVKATLQERGQITNIVMGDLDNGQPNIVAELNSGQLPGLFSSLISVSPDGTNLVYVTAQNETMDNATIYLFNVASGNKQPLVNITSGFWPSRPVWSKDGSQLSYVVRETTGQGRPQQLTLWVVGISPSGAVTSSPRRVAAPAQLEATLFYNDPGDGPLCWSTDSTRLVVRAANSFKQTEVFVSDGQVRSDVTKPPSIPNSSPAPNLISQKLNKPLLAPVGDGNCFVSTFSQNDPKWQDQLMLPSSTKIGEGGCPLTAAAIMLNYYKVNTTPALLNTCLGSDADPITGFDWSLPANRCSLNQVHGGQSVEFSWDTLNNTLKLGQPVIVGMLGGQNQSHFVVVVGGSDSIAATYRVNDPWDGTNYKSLGYFLEKGYRLNSIINYSSNGGITCSDRTILPQRFEPGFKLISPVDGGLYNKAVPINYTISTDAVVTGTLIRTVSTPEGATSQTSQSVSNGLLVSEEGSYSLVMVNSYSASNPIQVTANFVVDFTPPVVELASLNTVLENNPNPNEPQLATKTVPLRFRATDALSGIASVQYKINDSGWFVYPIGTNSQSVDIKDPGLYNLVYRATDGAGNVSGERSLQFQIVPTNTGTTVPGGGATATTVPVVVPPTNPPVIPPTNPPVIPPTNPPPDTIAPVATTVTVPISPTTAPTGDGTLTAAPASLTFDPTQNQSNLVLNNPSSSPVTWTLQPLSGDAATYLQFSTTSGTIPPGGNQTVTVLLTTFNVSGSPITSNSLTFAGRLATAGPINLTFNISYNNNTAGLSVAVTINPQPTPTVTFTSPAAGPMIAKSTSIKLQVVPAGLAKPNHITIKAKYAEVPNGAIVEKLLMGGQQLVAPDWSLLWDISAIPPQAEIGLFANVCWSADESVCIPNAAALTGISVPQPSAAVTLSPANTNLSGVVNISAQTTGQVNHITFKYTTASGTTTLVRADATNGYTSKWDATLIPPQTGIILSILVCWSADDNAASCVQPSNAAQLPPAFTVLPPTLTLNPLPDTISKELPIQVPLSGTASNIINPATAVFIVVKAPNLTQDNNTTKVSPLSVGAGPTNWTTSIDTTTWQPGALITFASKICWDGNDKGSYCYDGPTAVGAISNYSALLSAPIPTDLSISTSFFATATPANRATVVKMLVSYTNSNNLVGINNFVDQELLLQSDSGNKFKLPFDSVLLGLKPGQITVKLVACGSSGACGQPSDPLTLSVPDSSLTSLNPDQATLFHTSLTSTPTLTLGGKVSGRGATRLQLIAYYQTQLITGTTSITKTFDFSGSPLANQNVSFSNVDFQDVPPQEGINIAARFCWRGTLDQVDGCSENVIYNNLFITHPKVTNVYLNGTTTGAYTGPYLLIPVTNTATSLPPILTIPVSADTIASLNVQQVNWQAAIPGNSNLLGKATTSLNPITGAGTESVNLNISTSTIPPDSLSFNIIASPIWNSNDGKTKIIYNTAISDTIIIPVKLVRMSVAMDGSNGDGSALVQLTPSIDQTTTTAITNTLMFKDHTNFKGTFDSSTIGGLVKKVLFYSTTNSDPTPQYLGSANATASGWSFDWVHSTSPSNPNRRPSLDDTLSLSWRLCSASVADDTQADTACTSRNQAQLNPNIPGTLTQLGNLKLVGVQFDENNSSTLIASNNAFNSTFTAIVELRNTTFFTNTNSKGVVKQVRLYASPANSTRYVDAVPLKVTSMVVNNTTTAQLDVYWPDDNSAFNSTTAHSLGNLISQTQNRAIQISAQYCTSAATNLAYNDPSCSDWKGMEIEQTTQNSATPWRAYAVREQEAIITWRIYRGTTQDDNAPALTALYPYDEWLLPNDPITDAKLTVKVRRVDPVSARFNPILSVSFQKLVSSGGGDIPVSITASPDNSNSPATYTFEGMWPINTIFSSNLDGDTAARRSVKLRATLNDAGTAEVLTHGAAVPTISNVKVTNQKIYKYNEISGFTDITSQALISWTTNISTSQNKDQVFYVKHTTPAGTYATKQSSLNNNSTTHAVSLNATDLATPGQYDYQVSSIDGTNETHSPVFNFTSLATPLDFVNRYITVTLDPLPASPVVTLSWNTNISTTTHSIIYSEDSTFLTGVSTPNVLGCVSPPTQSCNFITANLVAGKTYYYKIEVTFNDEGNNAAYILSYSGSFKTTPNMQASNFSYTPPPPPPPTPTPWSTNITWTTTVASTSLAECNTVTNFGPLPAPYPTAGSKDPNPTSPSNRSTSHLIPNLGGFASGTLYYCRLISVDNNTPTPTHRGTLVYNGASPLLTFTTPVNPPVITFVNNGKINLTAKDGGDIKWTTDVSSVCTFTVTGSTPSGATVGGHSQTNTAGTSFTETLTNYSSVPSDTAYDYTITCTTQGSTSSTTTPTHTFTIPDNVAPNVSGLAVTQVTNTPGSVKVSWSVSDNSTPIKCIVGGLPTSPITVNSGTSPAAPSTTATGLTSGNYTVSVTCTDSAVPTTNTSSASNLSFTIPKITLTPPVAPISGDLSLNLTKDGGDIKWTTDVSSVCTFTVTGAPVGTNIQNNTANPSFTETLSGYSVSSLLPSSYSYIIDCSAGTTSPISRFSGNFQISDNTPPAVTVPVVAQGANPAGSVGVSWTVSDNSTPISCIIDVLPNSASIRINGAVSPYTRSGLAGGSYNVLVSGLTGGSYTVSVTCTDSATNTSSTAASTTAFAIPTISGLTASATGGVVTVKWNTDIFTDAQVVCTTAGPNVSTNVFDTGYAMSHTAIGGTATASGFTSLFTAGSSYTCTVHSTSQVGGFLALPVTSTPAFVP